MTPKNLALAMDMLTRPIPAPKQPKAKPQDSWATLKPGQWLRNLSTVYIGTDEFEPGNLWSVWQVDSLGALLACGDSRFTFRDRNWKGKLFARARKPKATKKGKTHA